MKNVVIKYSNEQIKEWPSSAKYAIEQLINSWEDFAYGYDLNDEAVTSICHTLEDVDVDFIVEGGEEEDV